METFKMSVRQACFMTIGIITASKLIFMTSVTAEFAKEGILFSILVDMLINAIFIAVTLNLDKKFHGKTIYCVISEKFGKPAAKIIFFILFIIFFLKSYLPIFEHEEFIKKTLYETAPLYANTIPFFVLSIYFSYKGFKGLARSSDILVWFTITGCICLILLTIPNVDLTQFLPVFARPEFILKASVKTALWHFDSIYFLLLVGHIKQEKKSTTKIFLSYLLSTLITLVYSGVIYGEYGILTERQYFPPVQMGMISVALINVGRIDYFAAITISFSQVFSAALPLFFATYCIQKVFGFKNKFIAPVAVNILSLAIVSVTSDYLYVLYEFLTEYAIYPIATVSIVFPLILSLLKHKHAGVALYE